MANPGIMNDPRIESVQNFISGAAGSRGFYIPPYQRPFSWDDDEIARLFEDVVEGINQIANKPERHDAALSFIGTVVCMHDTEFKGVDPKYKNDVPDQVYVVIDGQQRITVLLAIVAMMHDYMRSHVDGIEPGSDLYNKTKDVIGEIEGMIEIHLRSGEYRHYPRMIRSWDDRWAKTLADKIYKSPISHFIHNYGKFYRAQGNEHKQFPVTSDTVEIAGIKTEEAKARRSFYKKVDNVIKPQIRKICEGIDQDILHAGMKDEALKALLGLQEIKNLFRRDNPKECQIARALALCGYFLKRVQFVTLVTTDEERAFDIFDSLNTTGTPLTPYETFRPKVVKQEGGLGKFEKSEVKGYIGIIDDYLDSLSKKKEKEKRTSDILVSFALAECGKNLSKKPYEQRKFLKDEYEKYDRLGRAKGHEFVRHLTYVSETYQYLWDGKLDTGVLVQRMSELQDKTVSDEFRQASFCLKFLGAANHTIQISLIARFYEALMLADLGDRKQRALSLCQAIKAVSAFFAIWRASREHTDGIDSRYRKIMSGSLPEGRFKKFQRHNSDGIPDIHELRKALCYALREDGGNSKVKISSGKEWVETSKDIPIYRTSRAVAKFIILLASHRARPDEKKPGLLIGDVREGRFTSLIDRDVWGDEPYRTIEHIIPQSKFEEFVQDGHPEHAHRLGNLTLLPESVNAMINDRGWGDEKRAIYRMLASETESEFNKNSKHVLSAKIISEESVDKLRKGRCLPMTAAVAQCDDFNSLAHIDKRGKNLLELAWPTLSKWLDFKTSE